MPAPQQIYSVSVDGIALVAATAKTILEIATPSTADCIPILWWVEFDGVTASNTPVKVEVGRFSAAVTTATTVTPAKVNYGGNALASQLTVKHSTTTEGAGTASDVEIHRVSPTSGAIWQESLGNEWSIGPSSFYRIRCTAAQATNVTFGVRWLE
jgi:hypothetical protein